MGNIIKLMYDLCSYLLVLTRISAIKAFTSGRAIITFKANEAIEAFKDTLKPLHLFLVILAFAFKPIKPIASALEYNKPVC